MASEQSKGGMLSQTTTAEQEGPFLTTGEGRHKKGREKRELDLSKWDLCRAPISFLFFFSANSAQLSGKCLSFFFFFRGDAVSQGPFFSIVLALMGRKEEKGRNISPICHLSGRETGKRCLQRTRRGKKGLI